MLRREIERSYCTKLRSEEEESDPGEVAQAVSGKCTKSNLEIVRRKRALRGFYFVTVTRRARSDSGEACVGGAQKSLKKA